MKQTIAELGIGGEGWMIYDDHILPKKAIRITVVDNWKDDNTFLIPRFLLREYLEYSGVKTTSDLVVFGNEIVYSTKEEAEEELKKEVSDTITSVERKNVDWKKMLSELNSIQKQFKDIIEDHNKAACTFGKKLRNIANPQPDSINWNQVRIDAAISVLNALLETTKHSVLEELVVKEVFAKIAVGYADKLVYELKRSEALFEEKLKEM